MIIRSKRNTNYTMLSNTGLNDDKLSFKAKGILAYLLSKPDHWQISERHLASVGQDGRDAVRSGLRELTKYGYLVRQKYRDERGKFHHRSFVYDEPQSTPKDQTDSPWLENPTLGNSTLVKPTQVSTDVVSTERVNTCASAKERTFIKEKQDEDMELKEVDQHLRNSTNGEWERNKDEVWNSLPSSYKQVESNGELEKTNEWAKRFRLLDNTSDIVRRVSYVVAKLTQYEPVGVTKQNWIKQINDLWAAAGQREAVLIDGLKAGENSRTESNLTFSGPRSYQAFVRQALSLTKKQEQGVEVGRDTDSELENKPIAENGQISYLKPDGTRVVEFI